MLSVHVYTVRDHGNNYATGLVGSTSDTLFLSGLADADGNAICFESEAYHLDEWADKHGMYVQKHIVALDLDKKQLLDWKSDEIDYTHVNDLRTALVKKQEELLRRHNNHKVAVDTTNLFLTIQPRGNVNTMDGRSKFHEDATNGFNGYYEALKKRDDLRIAHDCYTGMMAVVMTDFVLRK